MPPILPVSQVLPNAAVDLSLIDAQPSSNDYYVELLIHYSGTFARQTVIEWRIDKWTFLRHVYTCTL